MAKKIPEDIKDRARALEVLRAYRKGKRLDEARFEGLLHAAGPGVHLVTELVSGAVRQTARLDHHLLFFCRRASIPFLLT